MQKAFPDFLKRFQASSTSSSGSSKATKKAGSGEVFGEFWEAPSRFWQPKVRDLEEWEIDAISSGGASLH